jgi:hypothetical protein
VIGKLGRPLLSDILRADLLTSSLLLVLVALAADPAAAPSSVILGDEWPFAFVLRGQSPMAGPTMGEETSVPTPSFAPTQNALGSPPVQNPLERFTPLDATPVVPAAPQPRATAWKVGETVGFLSSAAVHGGGASGQFGVFEYDSGNVQSSSWLTSQFNYRSWSGPSNPALPSNVYRFAFDVLLTTPADPVGIELAFTPALVSDLDAPVGSDAFNWDGRAALHLRASPELAIILGVAYWDRVNDITIPYGGITWNPSDYWRFALTFPKASVNAFLLNWGKTSVWLYGGFEYHVEAYQIDLGSPAGPDEKIQLADFRSVLGMRWDGEEAAALLEGGWVFDRQVKFLHGTPGFDIGTASVIRFGLLF